MPAPVACDPPLGTSGVTDYLFSSWHHHCWLGVVVKAFVRQPRGRCSIPGRVECSPRWVGNYRGLNMTWPAAVVVVQRRLLKYGVSLWLDQHGTVACDPPLGTSGVTDYLSPLGGLAFPYHCWLGVVVKAFVRQPRGRVFDPGRVECSPRWVENYRGLNILGRRQWS